METNKQIAIIGYGFVGKATEYLFDRFYPGTDIQIHDQEPLFLSQIQVAMVL